MPIREGMDCDQKTLPFKNTGSIKNLQEQMEETQKKIDSIEKKLSKTADETKKNTTRMKRISEEISDKMKARQKKLDNA